eukprot:jgi/Bigna1/142654/aug1.72_g17362
MHGFNTGLSNLQPGQIHIYNKEEKAQIIRRYLAKKKSRKFRKVIRYACRKRFADRRPRVGGRFVKMKPNPPEKKGKDGADNSSKGERKATMTPAKTNIGSGVGNLRSSGSNGDRNRLGAPASSSSKNGKNVASEYGLTGQDKETFTSTIEACAAAVRDAVYVNNRQGVQNGSSMKGSLLHSRVTTNSVSQPRRAH